MFCVCEAVLLDGRIRLLLARSVAGGEQGLMGEWQAKFGPGSKPHKR